MMATEKRLIDANALLIDIDNYYNNSPFTHPGTNWTRGLELTVGLLLRAPTVDAVEVVRCKDCKHYDNSEGICWCKLNSKFYPGGMDWHSFPENGFCSYGERKDND